MTARTRSRTGAPRPATVTEAFRAATQVADAVLFEGYVLYPYRASARKNQLRWQFGVLGPVRPDGTAAEELVRVCESRWQIEECLAEAKGEVKMRLTVGPSAARPSRPSRRRPPGGRRSSAWR